MALIDTITDSNHFYNWLQRSDTYKNQFSYEGAQALQEYLEDLSDDLGENIDFDLVAWCCEYSEYNNALEAYKKYKDDDATEAEAFEWLNNNTQVIAFNNGVIIQDF